MITVDEAIDRLLATVTPLAPVRVRARHAAGRVLAEDVPADRDVPATDRSAMDGFAVRSDDLGAGPVSLRISGQVRAGESGAGVVVAPGACVRLFTGAVIPEGADAVVMVERAVEDGAAGTVTLDDTPRPGQHVRRRGEDRRRGEVVVPQGSVIRPAEIASLAAVGRLSVRVIRPPRVAILSTGDEVVAAGRTPRPHQVRNSNAAMLAAQLSELGLAGSFLGIAPDDEPSLDALLEAGLRYDVLLVTGGVSVGAYDLVAASLARRGVEVLFHTVAMRPGKPILAARRSPALVLGLPGNPVSAFTSFHVFAAPALRKLSGDPHPVRVPRRARLTRPLARRPGRRVYALGRLAGDEVAPVPSASSGDLFALARANAFIVVEGADGPVQAGEAVDVLPWNGEAGAAPAA